jgi:hypothetical protein
MKNKRALSNDKRVINSVQNTYAFGFTGEKNGRHYYKYVRFNSFLIEAADMVEQKSYNNSVVQLRSGTFTQVQKLFVTVEGEWKMIVTLIRDNLLTEMVSLDINELASQCIAMWIDQKIYAMPLLQSFHLLLR